MSRPMPKYITIKDPDISSPLRIPIRLVVAWTSDEFAVLVGERMIWFNMWEQGTMWDLAPEP